MSPENKLAIFEPGETSGLLAPVCPKAEYQYICWLANLLVNGGRLYVRKGRIIDRRMNDFEAYYSKKGVNFGMGTIILPEMEQPAIGFLLDGSTEAQKWLDGIEVADFDPSVVAMVVRRFWGDQVTVNSWLMNNIRSLIGEVWPVGLRNDLRVIFQRRDQNWMTDMLKLLLRNLERVEVK